MVGGNRRDGDHDDFGHRAHARDRRPRKRSGARRREILWQFLIEAAFLTSAGGLLGIVSAAASV
jgi:ABC-type antimicrobial peptide transport system permease subunit